MKRGMIKLSAFYPNGEGKTFDMDYYREKHIPMVAELLGDACKAASVETGLAGLGDNTPPPYAACGPIRNAGIHDKQPGFSIYRCLDNDQIPDDIKWNACDRRVCQTVKRH